MCGRKLFISDIKCQIVCFHVVVNCSRCVLVLLSVSLTSLPTQAGKVRKHVSEQEKAEDGLGPNMKSIVTMLMLMLLMMFAVHCT